MLTRIKVKSFTLLECLIALLVIAGSMTIYQNLTALTAHHVQLLSDSRQGEWLLFCQQFRQELSGTNFVKVDGNRLYVTKGKQDLAFGLSRHNDFRKTNANGKGYQPMLYGLTSARLTEKAGILQLDVIFDNGLERSFIYAFDQTG